MRIYVESVYGGHDVAAVIAKGKPGDLSISRRQYQNALRRLCAPTGDGLRLSPVNGNGVGQVVVLDGRPGRPPWAVIE